MADPPISGLTRQDATAPNACFTPEAQHIKALLDEHRKQNPKLGRYRGLRPEQPLCDVTDDKVRERVLDRAGIEKQDILGLTMQDVEKAFASWIDSRARNKDKEYHFGVGYFHGVITQKIHNDLTADFRLEQEQAAANAEKLHLDNIGAYEGNDQDAWRKVKTDEKHRLLDKLREQQGGEIYDRLSWPKRDQMAMNLWLKENENV